MGAKSEENQAQASESPLPTKSHRMCVIFHQWIVTCVKCCLRGKLIWAQESRVCIDSAMQSPSVCVLCSVMSDSLLPQGLAHQTHLSMWFPRQKYWNGLSFVSPNVTINGLVNQVHMWLTKMLTLLSLSSNYGIQYALIIIIMISHLPTFCNYLGTFSTVCVFSFTIMLYIYLSLAELYTIKRLFPPWELQNYK